jgi:hypothetical protein
MIDWPRLIVGSETVVVAIIWFVILIDGIRRDRRETSLRIMKETYRGRWSAAIGVIFSCAAAIAGLADRWGNDPSALIPLVQIACIAFGFSGIYVIRTSKIFGRSTQRPEAR